jgi:hypothetical protein
LRAVSGQLRPIETTSISETPRTRLGRADQALWRVAEGPALDESALAAERMRKLVVLPVLSTRGKRLGTRAAVADSGTGRGKEQRHLRPSASRGNVWLTGMAGKPLPEECAEQAVAG